MLMNKLISIIVPVYKVEKYLQRCVDSILAQTYSDIEVLLIDDGSPDDSGKICDEYALKDTRVRAFHKKNGGVSSARNFGLKKAKGAFIGFVDSDDYIEKTMYETLLKNLLSEQADVSICGYYQEDKTGFFYRHWTQDDYLSLIGDEQIRCLISNQYYTCSCWDRLFKSELLENIYFDETVSLYEDYMFLYQVAKKSHKTVFTSQPFYYYCNTSNSASNSGFSSKTMDIVKICKLVMDDIGINFPQLLYTSKIEYTRININCCSKVIHSSTKYTTEIRELQRNVRHYILEYLFSYAAIGYKILAMCIALNWSLFEYIIKKMKK